MPIIEDALLWKAPRRKLKISDVRTYKKITLNSTILLILLKNRKNRIKGETCAKKPIINNAFNLCLNINSKYKHSLFYLHYLFPHKWDLHNRRHNNLPCVSITIWLERPPWIKPIGSSRVSFSCHDNKLLIVYNIVYTV